MSSAPSFIRRQLGRGRRALAQFLGRGGRPEAREPNAVTAGVDRYSELVTGGERPAAAALRSARECLAADNLPAALRLGYQLSGTPATAAVGEAVVGLCRLHTSTPVQAWARFARLSDPALIALAAPEYFQAGCVEDPTAADRAAHALLQLKQADRPEPGVVLKVAQATFSVGSVDVAGSLVAAARAGTFGELTENQAYQFERLATWLPDGARRRPIELPDADLRFGVIDYKQPDNSSRNVGDFIQTLASLGHLVRHDNLRFVGDPELVAFVDDLRGHVRPERRLDDAGAVVHLVELQRDGNRYQDLPEPTWAFMFGWYLHPTFAAGYSFPFNPAIRPLFVSFHLNKPDALTAEGVDYLRRHSPIGCRDWQTVAMLTGAGVPAFFSGCITTTVDTVFARTGPDTRSETGYVDAREGTEDDDGVNIEQSVGDIRREPLPTNLALARAWVNRYHEDYRRVVTSRLHSYLPARSVGCEVEFSPANRSDPRFGGLIEIDDDAFEAIRQGILAKLAVMVELLASGAGEDEVYRRWNELCAPDVAAAEAFLGSRRLPELALPRLDAALPTDGRVVLVDAARNQPAVARLVTSIIATAPDIAVVAVGPATRDLPPEVLCITEPPVAERGGVAQRHNLLVATVLAELPAGTRVLLLPPDAVVRGSISEVFDTDLQDAAIAARPDIRRNRHNHDTLLRRISARQGADFGAALDFLAVTHRRPGHGSVPFDPRVALLSAGRLAAAGWPELARPLIETYGATLAEALNIVLAERFRPLPASVVSNVALEDPDPAAALLVGLAQSRLGAGDFVPR